MNKKTLSILVGCQLFLLGGYQTNSINSVFIVSKAEVNERVLYIDVSLNEKYKCGGASPFIHYVDNESNKSNDSSSLLPAKMLKQ